MTPRVARALLRLYPRPWRERYGAELEWLLEAEGQRREGSLRWLRTVLDVVGSASTEQIYAMRGGWMGASTYSFGGVMRRPSAFLPVAMSLTAFALVLGFVLRYGAARQADEGAVAHLWQLLMAGQVPIMVFFAIKWLPRAGRAALLVLGEQVGAALASAALVFFLGL